MLAESADWASIIGLLVSIVGFILTVWNVRESKAAAVLAREASEAARDEVLRGNAIFDLAKAVTTMEEIKRLQRQGAWLVLPDRYSSVRTALTSIRASKPDLSDDGNAAIQGAVSQFRALEKKVESANASGDYTSLKVSTLNDIVSQQIEKLSELQGTLRYPPNG